MKFLDDIKHLSPQSWSHVASRLESETLSLEDVATLLNEEALPHLETIAQAAHRLTVKKFGRVMKLFAPVYISNHCINDCTYCGFKRDNPTPRLTLSADEVVREAEVLISLGYRHLLLVAGEHPGKVTIGLIETIAQHLRPRLSGLSIEVQPFFHADTYRRFAAAGVDGVVIYQETYDREAYRQFHLSGPKKNWEKRLAAIDAAGHSGMRFLGIGALFGLAHWQQEAMAIVAHARWLTKHHWQSQISVSFPRITPGAPGFVTPHPISDREFTQLICVLRLALPDADLVLSTREPAWLRDHLMRCGITRMSAGSRTEPGGYLHPGEALPQFQLEDLRTPEHIAQVLAHAGFDPVWKDGHLF